MRRCLGCMESYDDKLDICPHCGYVEGTMPEEAIHIIPGTILHERYIVGKVVGYGGFGVTYIAWDTLLEHKIAIKEYLPSEFSTRVPGKPELTIFNGDKSQQFEDGMKKFLDEARRLAKFQNESGIVKVYDCFEENRTAYIIMEYLEGITLSDYLNENGCIPEDVAVQMLLPIMNSLKNVHKEGIIHRDIAPDNIMITSKGEIKLIDFGAARYATTSHSRSLTVIIKPGYSPEEQYRSRGDQGPHTDVHAIGAVLYRMITGCVPPDAMERRAYFENSNKDILDPLSKYVKNISTNKENAILNAMNVRIEDRSPDMDTLIHELTTDEPVARVCGKIKKIDILKWPLWLKITVPTAMAAIVTLIVLFITGVIGFDLHSPREIYIPDGMTRVPRIVSMDEASAQTMLEEKNLNYSVSGTKYDEQIEAGCIMRQMTSVGSVVPINYPLQVIISAGIEQIEMPYITGYTKEHAIEELETAYFGYTFVEEYDSVIENGCVISQSVEGGVGTDKGSNITIVVSKGRNPETDYSFSGDEMPDLYGKSLIEAKNICEKYGIRLVVTDYQYSAECDGMCVLSQMTAAGSYIQNDIVVEVTLSKGALIYRIPSLIYLTETEAVEKLNEKELKYNITYSESETVAAGCVISQSVEAGTIVEPTTVIDIVVSSGPPKFDMVNVVGDTEKTAIETLQEKGLIVVTEYTIDDSVDAGTVIKQSVNAGEKVYKGYEVTITVSSKTTLVLVPDVMDKTFDEAKVILTDAGFKFEKNEIYNAEIEAGKVITQAPGAGTSQKPGTTLLLTVSLGKEPVNITFDGNGITLSENKKVVYVTETYGELPTPSRENHTFLGWYTNPTSGSNITSDTVVTGNTQQILYAHWSKDLVKVKFDANGGATNGVDTYMGLGDVYVLPSATKEFYSFDGWYTQATGGEKVTNETIITNKSEHTLYAHWTNKTVVVTYDAGNGKITGSDSITYKLGECYQDITASRQGYVFIGWYTKENGAGDKVLLSTIVSNESNHTLYAYYSKDAYEVTLDANGGSCENKSMPVVYDTEYGTLPAPTRTYYTFDGWYTSASGGTKVTDTTTVSTAKNHTLYAHWTRKTVEVAYMYNGGSESIEKQLHNLGDTYYLPDTTKTGYTFDGWYTESGEKVTSSDIVTENGNHTLYARWSANTYVVTFKFNGGQNYNNPNAAETTVNVKFGENYKDFPIDYIRYGYNFVGWYTASTGGTNVTKSTTVSTAKNHSVYAHWEANKYDVYYDANGGTGSMSSSEHTYGVASALRTNSFKRTYYTFKGWNTKKDGTGRSLNDKASVSDLVKLINKRGSITLYAQWEANAWSDIVESLPSGVNSSTYEIKNITQYRYSDYILDEGTSIPSGYSKYGEYIKYGEWVTGDWTTDVLTCDDLTRKLVSSDEYVITPACTRRRMFAWKYLGSNGKWYYNFWDGCGGEYIEYIDYDYEGNFASDGDVFTDANADAYDLRKQGVLSYAANDRMYECHDAKYLGDLFFIGLDIEDVPEVKGMKYKYATRSATKMYKYRKEGAWSDWSTTEYTASSTRQVKTRTVYKYRKK